MYERLRCYKYMRCMPVKLARQWGHAGLDRCDNDTAHAQHMVCPHCHRHVSSGASMHMAHVRSARRRSTSACSCADLIASSALRVAAPDASEWAKARCRNSGTAGGAFSHADVARASIIAAYVYGRRMAGRECTVCGFMAGIVSSPWRLRKCTASKNNPPLN